MDEIDRIRALTGITTAQVPDSDLEALLALHEGRVYCAAADAADRIGNGLIDHLDVTAVEDISIDTRRVMDGWRGLADRLRKRCLLEEAEAWDDGPAVVEFRPHGYGWGPEAVEHG
jgi:hypothetical protein